MQAGIVVIYLASSFSGGRMAGNMAGKRRFLWGICFGIVYFAILIIVSAVFLPGGFAGAEDFCGRQQSVPSAEWQAE